MILIDLHDLHVNLLSIAETVYIIPRAAEAFEIWDEISWPGEGSPPLPSGVLGRRTVGVWETSFEEDRRYYFHTNV